MSFAGHFISYLNLIGVKFLSSKLVVQGKISITLPNELIGTIRVVTFNLGYLPGGNKELITKPETTLSALIQAYDYLTEDGIISLIVYRGHPGGQDEYDQLEKLMKEKNWAFEKSTGNQSDDCPVLFLIRKT